MAESKIKFTGDASSVTRTLEKMKAETAKVGTSLKKNIGGGISSITSGLGNISSMTADASSSLSGMGANLAKLGPIGVAAGVAIASIGAGIANSQALSDMFAKTWERIKSLFGVIGKSLGQLLNGDFSGAWESIANGTSKAWGAAGKYADALDNLGTNTITFSQQEARLNRDMKEQQAIIADTNKSYAERKKAQEDLIKLNDEYTKASTKQADLQQQVADAYIEKLLAESGQSDKFTTEEKARLQDYLTAVDGTIDDLQALGGKWANVYDKISDSEYRQFADYYSAAQTTARNVAETIKANNKLINKDLNDNPLKVEVKVDEYAEGTIGWIEKEIAKLEKEKKNVIPLSVEEQSINREIEKLRAQLQNVEVEVEVKFPEGSIGAVREQIAQLNKEMENTVYGSDAYKALKEQIDALNASITETNSNLTQQVDNADGMSNVFGSASGALGQFASQSEEAAVAQKSLAVAEQLAAMASAIHTASSGGDPYTVPARIIASAGAIVAAFASMASAKFAGGGIVGGSSYAGDSQLIRANSGEIVLNTSQQARLWNALNNSNLGGGYQGGNVTFTIKGNELQGCLNNNSQTKNRLK